MSTYEILKNGNLKIMITEEERKELQEIIDCDEGCECTDHFFIEAIEDVICNGLMLVSPEDVGALTDSLILSEGSHDDNGDFPNDSIIWWFPEYQTVSPGVELLENKCVIFTKRE